LDAGNSITRGDLDFEVNYLTAIKGTFTVHTALAAASVNLPDEVVILVINVQSNIGTVPRVSNLSEVLALAIFNVGDSDFGSVAAVAGTFARSVKQQEGFSI